MSHIQHTFLRGNTIYYNRRVPKELKSSYGTAIRVNLGSDERQARALATRMTDILDVSFRTGVVVDYQKLTSQIKPRSFILSEIATEYVQLKDIDELSPRLAVQLLSSVSGDIGVESYTRDDARAFVRALEDRGVSTSTIRRRINSISAILNYAYAELDIDKRNPFTRVMIKGEGKDRKKRGTFTVEQLKEGYEEALSFGSHVRLLFPILGETGCRIGEIVGLRLEDIDLDEGIIHIRPHTHRRLKTTGSERSLPLLGYAEKAVREALRSSDGVFVFPQYYKPNGFVATHASNALNKWTKERFGGLTAHSLRHTMRDRLRSVEAPLELIDQIGGWSSVGGAGTKYGKGYEIHHTRVWLEKVKIKQ